MMDCGEGKSLIFLAFFCCFCLFFVFFCLIFVVFLKKDFGIELGIWVDRIE